MNIFVKVSALLMLPLVSQAMIVSDSEESFIPKKNLECFVYNKLNISTFRTSFDAQRRRGVRHFAGLGAKATQLSDNMIKVAGKGWRFSIHILERRDVNGDGIEDLLVQYEDLAEDGSHKGSGYLLLSRFSAKGKLIALAYEPDF